MKNNKQTLVQIALTTTMATTMILLPVRLAKNSQEKRLAQEDIVSLQVLNHFEGVQSAGNTQSVATAISENSVVVGTVFNDESILGFIAQGDKGKILPPPGGMPYSQATDVNDKNEVVGAVGSEESVRAVVWSRDVSRVLNAGKWHTLGRGITNRGVAVGLGVSNENRDVFRAFFAFSHNVPYAFAPFSASASYGAFQWGSGQTEGKNIGTFIPEDVNNNDLAAGWVPVNERKVDAVMARNGKLTHLPCVRGIEHCRAFAINDREQVVGFAIHADKVAPVLWERGRATVLNVGRNAGGAALGISRNGDVVGMVMVNDREGHAALWRNGKLTDLDTLIPPDKKNITLAIATDVNSKGEICGICVTKERQRRAFILKVR